MTDRVLAGVLGSFIAGLPGLALFLPLPVGIGAGGSLLPVARFRPKLVGDAETLPSFRLGLARIRGEGDARESGGRSGLPPEADPPYMCTNAVQPPSTF